MKRIRETLSLILSDPRLVVCICLLIVLYGVAAAMVVEDLQRMEQERKVK